MTDWRQVFDVRRAPYLRPNETWICGRSALGVPCRLGPSGMGRCRTRTECDPISSQGEWVCTRPGDQGGKCEEGPSADGACCRQIPKCVPVRNLRSLRGRITFWVFAATLLGLVGALGTDLRFSIFDPGPVIQGHSGVASCDSCHTAGGAHVGDWFRAAWAPDNPAASSAKCLTCHDRGKNALLPHSLPKARLAMHTERIPAPAMGFDELSTHLENGTVFPTDGSVRETLACATCHKDHKGLNFDPNVVPNGRCQTCHKQKFASLANGHPSFGHYPYVRRSRLAFDHYKHFQNHFGQAKGRPPTKCADCHEPDPTGRYMVVMPFETTCGACHTKDIEGTALTGAKGIPVFSVPGLDTETLAAKGFGVGQWPKDADSDGISPFIKTLLAADAKLDADLHALAGVDLQDLGGANKSVLAAVRRVAWGLKELLYELGRYGSEAVHVRFANGFGLALDREAVGRLAGNIPRDVVRAAQTRWFPRLESEIARYRKRRAGLIIDDPVSHAGLFDTGKPVRARPVRLALAGPAESRTLFGLGLGHELFDAFRPRTDTAAQDRPNRRRLQLAQTGDLLNGNSNLIDGSSLRLKEYKELQREDKGADNSIFKKGGSSRAPVQTRAAPEETKKKSVAKKQEKEPEPKKTVAKKPGSSRAAKKTVERKETPVATQPAERQQAEQEKTSEPAAEETAGADTAPGRDKARPELPPAELSVTKPVLKRPAKMTKLGPLPDPETWARSGGWYRVDFTLFYRPAAHKDAFMQSWLDFAAAAHGGPAQLYGEALLSTFRNTDTVGKCVRCHSVDRIAGGRLTVNWKPFTPNPDEQKFTVFDHATHFSMAGERGCQSCHRLNPKAKFAVAYRGLDATSFESNFFAPIKRETCAECHVPETAGNACIQCHRYHVGQFVSAPIVTEIAARHRPMTRLGAAPRRSAQQTPEKPSPAASSRSAKGETQVGSNLPDTSEIPLPKPKPAVTPIRTGDRQASSGGDYAVRLGSYLSKKRADRSLGLLERSVAAYLSGQTLRIERAKISRGRIIYRVVARPFDKRDAEATCRQIAAKRKIRCLVTR